MGYANLGGYVAAKHGVVGLTRTAALEYAADGIRVNCVCPGWIETPMVMDRGHFRASKPEVHERLIRQTPSRRLGTPEEVAAAVLWLSSDASSFVTGHALAIDGGTMSGLEGVYGTPLA
jgi:NAD(P)-dependent dehydrogenase (short-subunit alcohol dehydrogenase family)